MYSGYLTDVEGIEVGHYQNEDGMTGVTVVIAREGATGGVDVRGSAPGTRETDLFQERKAVDKIHSVVLAGGSAFGLDAAGGVMKYLEEEGIGFETGVVKVPIVTSAVIFDLGIGDKDIRPDFQMGYKASKNSEENEKLQGNIGGGTGATVGKILGQNNSMKSGLGSASVKVGDLVVAAMVVVNAAGDIYNSEKNEKIAGVYDYKNNKLLDTLEIMKSGYKNNLKNTNTTIGIIATNGILDKAGGNKVAEMAHNGYARCIKPVHTTFDGDTIFTMATNKVEADLNLIGTLGVEAMEKAIYNAIVSAESYGEILAYRDINI